MCILFSIYTSQLGKLIDKHGFDHQQFADDTQLQRSFYTDPKSSTEAIDKFETCCDDIKSWMITNKLKLNDGKTGAILCATEKTKSNITIDSLRVGNSTIKFSDNVRNLGILIDSHLDMSSQINSLARTCNYHIRQLGKIRPFIDENAAKTIASATIMSRLDYCNSILWGLPSYQLNKLQKIQNTAARIVKRVGFREHITPVLKELHWLPVKFRIDHKISSLTYKCLNDMAPGYLTNIVSKYTPTRNLRSTSSCLITKSGYNTSTNLKKYGARSFKNAAPVLWNNLTLDLQNANSLDIFKKRLKTFYFDKAFVNDVS